MEKKKCLNCGETVNTKGRFCSAECHEEHELELDSLELEPEEFQQADKLFYDDQE
jgi:hypothetical protein